MSKAPTILTHIMYVIYIYILCNNNNDKNHDNSDIVERGYGQ